MLLKIQQLATSLKPGAERHHLSSNYFQNNEHTADACDCDVPQMCTELELRACVSVPGGGSYGAGCRCNTPKRFWTFNNICSVPNYEYVFDLIDKEILSLSGCRCAHMMY